MSIEIGHEYLQCLLILSSSPTTFFSSLPFHQLSNPEPSNPSPSATTMVTTHEQVKIHISGHHHSRSVTAECTTGSSTQWFYSEQTLAWGGTATTSHLQTVPAYIVETRIQEIRGTGPSLLTFTSVRRRPSWTHRALLCVKESDRP